MVASAAAEWRLAKSSGPTAVPVTAQAELRTHLAAASATDAQPGPDSLLAEGLTASSSSPSRHNCPDLKKASIIQKRRATTATCLAPPRPQEHPVLRAEHPLLGGLEYYSPGTLPKWRPLAVPADEHSPSANDCSSGSEIPSFRRQTSDFAEAISNLQPDSGSTREEEPKWFQPSDAVKVVSSPNCNEGGRARVLLVDRAEARYKVRMRNGSIRTVPASHVRPLRPSLDEAPSTNPK